MPGPQAVCQALVYSQVVLSFGIPFALIPLLLISRDRAVMTDMANRWLTSSLMLVTTIIITALNLCLLCGSVTGLAVSQAADRDAISRQDVNIHANHNNPPCRPGCPAGNNSLSPASRPVAEEPRIVRIASEAWTTATRSSPDPFTCSWAAGNGLGRLRESGGAGMAHCPLQQSWPGVLPPTSLVRESLMGTCGLDR